MSDFAPNPHSELPHPKKEPEHPRPYLRAVTDPTETEIPSKETLLAQRRSLLEKKALMERNFARSMAALDDKLQGINDAILGVSDTHDYGVRSRDREQKIKEYAASPESIIEHHIGTIQLRHEDIMRYKKMLAGERTRRVKPVGESTRDKEPLLFDLTDEEIADKIKLLQKDIDHAWKKIIEISSKVNESEREQKAA